HVPPVRRQRQQRPVQELPFGPPEPPLVLLLQPPHHPPERLLRPAPLVQERRQVALQLQPKDRPELLRRRGQLLRRNQRLGRAPGGPAGSLQRHVAEGELPIVPSEPPGPAQVSPR